MTTATTHSNYIQIKNAVTAQSSKRHNRFCVCGAFGGDPQQFVYYMPSQLMHLFVGSALSMHVIVHRQPALRLPWPPVNKVDELHTPLLHAMGHCLTQTNGDEYIVTYYILCIMYMHMHVHTCMYTWHTCAGYTPLSIFCGEFLQVFE